LIWSSWAQLAEHPELELADFLPSDMLGLVEAWLSQPLPDMMPTQWERDLARTMLRIREKVLRQELQETNGTLGFAKAENDLDAIARIKHRIAQISDRLREIQWALAQRPAQA
jgi:hypothetical protein